MNRDQKVKVVIDTNVLVSAVISKDSSPGDVVRLAILGEIENYTSEDILEEVERILNSEKVLQRIGSKHKDDIIRIYRLISIKVSPKIRVNVIERDPSDNKFLEAALEAKADFIITGDHHLLELREFRGVKILSPSDFLKLLKG